jgi:Mrp family chromosome partitioning ATPase/capsular polysaccharide biosynthesis protein
VDLLRFARIVRRRWALIAALAVAGAVVGAGSAAFHKDPVPTGIYYQATETLTNRHDQSGVGGSGFQSLNQVGVRVTSGDVPGRVAEKIGGTADELVDHITVTSNDNLGTLGITAVSPSADQAALLARTFSDELVASLDAEGVKTYQDDTTELISKRDALKSHEVDLDAQLAAATGSTADDLRAERDATSDELRLTLTQLAQHAFDAPIPSPVEVLEAAEAVPISRAEYQDLLARGTRGDHLAQVNEDGTAGVTAATTGPNLSGPGARGAVGALFGLFLGVGIAILLDAVDRRIRTRDELELAFGAPVLAEIPDVVMPKDAVPSIVSVFAPYSRAAEGYRAVRSAVLFELALAHQREADAAAGRPAPERPPGIVVMIASGVAAEGKTTTTANLAVAFAEAGSTVLAVNGDFRRPALHQQFGIADVPGAIADCGIAGVQVVTSMAVGESATPAQVVEAQRQLIHTTRRHYDIVLLDTAPLLSTNDASDIAPLADLVLVVTQYGVTKQHHARRTAEVLQRLRAPVGGLVFVATPTSGEDAGYAYYYGAPGSVAEPTLSAAAVVSGAPDVTSPNHNGNGHGHDHVAERDTDEVASVSWRAPLRWNADDRSE